MVVIWLQKMKWKTMGRADWAHLERQWTEARSKFYLSRDILRWSQSCSLQIRGWGWIAADYYRNQRRSCKYHSLWPNQRISLLKAERFSLFREGICLCLTHPIPFSLSLTPFPSYLGSFKSVLSVLAVVRCFYSSEFSLGDPVFPIVSWFTGTSLRPLSLFVPRFLMFNAVSHGGAGGALCGSP